MAYNQNKFTKIIVHIFVLLVFSIALLSGIMGVDFGVHWDEENTIGSITHSIEKGVLLPRLYNYPSLCYELAFAVFTVNAAPIFLDSGLSFLRKEGLKKIKEKLINISNSHLFNLHIRIIFIIISYLSIFWVYFLVLSWQKNWIEALLAASLLGLSLEVGYHARWIAPDAILMQFGALTMMCLFFAQEYSVNAKLHLRLSAIAAGLACGTKYPGGLLLAPVLLTAYYNFKQISKKRVLLYAFCGVLLIFVLTYLFTTPGTLLEPIRFIKYVWSAILQYGFWGLGRHTVTPGIKHLLLILIYFCMVVFSKYNIIACFFFVMSLIGIVSLLKNNKKTAFLFLCFPLLYIVLFSCQKAMIVRNYLVLIPFFAILSSRGCIFLYSKLRYRYHRILFSMFIVALLLINAFWLIKAANSIRIRNRVNYIEQLVRYIDRRQNILFFVSRPVEKALISFDRKMRPNVIRSFSNKAKASIFYSFELNSCESCLANKFNYTWLWFGPYEVNFNYYPDWGGDTRIIVMPNESEPALKTLLVD